MRIRRLTRRDCGAALPLLEAQYREHDIDMGGARLLGALRELLGGGAGFAGDGRSPQGGACGRKGLALIARQGAAAVGVAILSFSHTLERGGATAWLDELYVVPASRGRGVGGALLRRALREARREGCESMHLEVVRGHGRAARLYVREGFHRLPRTRYMRVL